MKIDLSEKYNIVLEEVFNPVLIRTAYGNAIAVCMRDETIEIIVKPKHKLGKSYRVDMQKATIEPMTALNDEIAEAIEGSKQESEAGDE